MGATHFNHDNTAVQLAGSAGCCPKVIYRDIQKFIEAGIVTVKVKGSYDNYIASVYEFVKNTPVVSPTETPILTKSPLEKRNRIFF